MRISQNYIKSIKDTAREFESVNHELLTRAGFIDQVASGIFTILPAGDRVLKKIEAIIRNEMNEIGALEIRMPSLHPKSLWEQTERWNSVDILFKVNSRHSYEYALGASHEEIVTPLAKKYIKSYRDLPLALYQIGTKFRDEPRPKSGILRGREFGMKDLYSFHAHQQDLDAYYQKVSDAYIKIFQTCGFTDIKITEASGGDFSKKHSHEFNVLTPAGEVNLVYCGACSFAQNEEVIQGNLKKCPLCGSSDVKTDKAVEIGNIFDLHTRFSNSFKLTYVDKNGENRPIVMGCYGIGITRLLGAIVEVYHKDDLIQWPLSVTPFHAQLINLSKHDSSYADLIYRTLKAEGFDILYDDREDVSAGEKFMTSELIGSPVRLVVSEKTKKNVEWKLRDDDKINLFSATEIIKKLKDFYSA